MFHEFADKLKSQLQKPLPGAAAHFKMLSDQMTERILVPREDARISSVLVVIYEKNGQPHTIYIKRQEYPGVHSGQISFPGGKQDPEDANLQETALREAREEISLDSANIEIIGKLTELYIDRSNYLVQPYVAIASKVNKLKPQPREVQKIMHVSFDEIINAPIKTFILERNNTQYAMPYFDIQNEVLWGATAMMTCELLEIVKPLLNSNSKK